MSQKETENLARVKTALADKYNRLARGCTSKPRREVLWRRAEHYRHQAEDLHRK